MSRRTAWASATRCSQPTYEGLKLHFQQEVLATETRSQPTYEGLKRAKDVYRTATTKRVPSLPMRD